jgi:L-ascorbate metabolism protein UlaG (beta-lactamase superfamily)
MVNTAVRDLTDPTGETELSVAPAPKSFRLSDEDVFKLKEVTAVARSSVRRYSREFLNGFKRNTKAGEVWQSELDHAAHDGPLVAAWLGHATILLRLGDKWILTDPVFSQRIGVRLGPFTFGTGRLSPAFDPGLLPPLDLILISHAHFDHLDLPSLRKLISDKTHVVTAASTRALLPKGFASVQELDWDKELRLNGLTLRAIKPNHWGARTAWDRHRGFNSYILEADTHRVLFAGDTAYTDCYAKLAKHGADLTVFGIGAYDPWIKAHANPEQVWDMHTQSGGQFLLPIHHSTFKLSDEPLDEPMKRMLRAADGQQYRVVGREMGQLWTPGHTIQITPEGTAKDV